MLEAFFVIPLTTATLWLGDEVMVGLSVSGGYSTMAAIQPNTMSGRL